MLGPKHLHPSFFDHDHDVVSFSNSLLSHFGVKPFHETNAAVDAILKGHKKVAVFLFDGMGEIVLKDYGAVGQKLLSHKFTTIYSTNPATTVASTNAFLSGRYPIETGWLGWSEYITELGRAINMFPGTDSYTGLDMNCQPLLCKKFGYENLGVLMRKAGVNAKVSYEYPLNGENGPKSLDEMREQASAFFQAGGEFLYSYWTKPDEYLHHNGVSSKFVQSYIGRINKMVNRFAKENPDVLLLVMADHGLIDVHYEDVAKMPDLKDLVLYPICIEPRTPSFFIKKGCEKEFEAAFEKHYGNRAVLMSKKEALDCGYFGIGAPKQGVESNLGDYVALMLDDTCIIDSRNHKDISYHKGHHAGGTDKERLIALLAFNQ